MTQDDPPSLRILYVLPYIPSPVRVRPFHFIRHLAALGHQVTVVALDDGLTAGAGRAEIEQSCRAVHIVPLPRLKSVANALASLPTPTPLWAAWCRSPAMSRLLAKLADPADFDIAQVEHLRAAHFAPSLKRLPAIIDAVDCITDLRRQMATQNVGSRLNRILSWVEWRKLRRYEPRVYHSYRRIAITSEHDSTALRSFDARLPPIDVIPNGVDLEYFGVSKVIPDDNCLVFSGKMSYSANDDAARYFLSDILPQIRVIRPNTHLIIVGSGPSKALLKMAARAGDVKVTGYVQDIRPHILQASVAVCPMRIGVGIQNKVLEAMSLSRPVVCSTLAARSLKDEILGRGPAALSEHKPILVADEPDSFAQLCIALLAAPDAAEACGKAARRYVEKYHDWKAATKRLVDVYRAVTSNA